MYVCTARRTHQISADDDDGKKLKRFKMSLNGVPAAAATAAGQ